MRIQGFVAAILGLLISFSASAQQLSDDYRRLIDEAAHLNGGAHFDATLTLISNVAPGGNDAVLAAVADLAPERLVQARAALGVETPSPAPLLLAETALPEPESAQARADLPASGPVDTGWLSAWSGRVAAGLSFVSGNSDQQSYTLGLHLDREFGDGWSLTNRLSYGYAESSGVVSQDQFQAESRVERRLNDRWGLFLGGQYDRDVLSSFDWTAFLSGGVTWQAIARDDIDWSLRAGPGVRYLVPTVGPSETQALLDLGSDFQWDMTDTTQLNSETTLLVADSSRLQQVFSLTTHVTEAWAVELGWRYQYEFEPLPGFEESDSTVTASLVREF